MNILETTKNWFCNSLETKDLSKTQRGIEREALRMNQDGFLSQQPHPHAYGSNLFHENITTDFSEALLEFITKPHETIGECLDELNQIHIYAHQNNPSEYLWPLSMPQ